MSHNIALLSSLTIRSLWREQRKKIPTNFQRLPGDPRKVRAVRSRGPCTMHKIVEPQRVHSDQKGRDVQLAVGALNFILRNSSSHTFLVRPTKQFPTVMLLRVKNLRSLSATGLIENLLRQLRVKVCGGLAWLSAATRVHRVQRLAPESWYYHLLKTQATLLSEQLIEHSRRRFISVHSLRT